MFGFIRMEGAPWRGPFIVQFLAKNNLPWQSGEVYDAYLLNCLIQGNRWPVQNGGQDNDGVSFIDTSLSLDAC